MFSSFYMAGFEATTGRNRNREWIDQIAATEHDVQVDSDYELITGLGIRTVREAMRWPLIDRGSSLNFSSVAPFIDAVRRHRVEVIWDLFHYGYPEDLDLFSEEFPLRFADYCHAASRYVARNLPGPYYFTPINEPSYFSWAAGEVGCFAPHAIGRGYELKLCLARAALFGIDAIRDACPGARIVNVDPICHVVPHLEASAAEVDEARHFNDQIVFQSLDMIAGALHPELGGSPAHLDIVGLNYYWTNQWEFGEGSTPLDIADPRRVPLAELVRRTHRRYGHEILISETSAVGDARAAWIDELSKTACELLDDGVPLSGICLYPILGMPEWHDRSIWTRMGLWDLEYERGKLQRRFHVPMLHALKRAQATFDARLALFATPESRETLRPFTGAMR